MAEALTAAIVLAIFLALSWIVRRFITDIAPRLVSKTRSSIDDELLKAIRTPVQVLIIVAGVYFACNTLNGLSPGIVGAIDKLAAIALILVGAYLVSNIISAFIRWYVADVAPKTGSDLDDHLLPFLQKVVVVLVYVIAGIMVLDLFIEVTPLIASLGVVGIAVAFAAKAMLMNIFGAMAILTDRPFKIGDRLYLDGIGATDVEDVGLWSTRVRTMDGRIVVVPNEKMASSHIVNISQPEVKLRVQLKVRISYASDAEKACAILESIASGTPGVSADPKPRAYLSELGDFAVTIMLLAYVDNYDNDLSVSDSIYRNALATFKKEGIVIPYPTVNVRPRVR
ncbi:putative small-conductance mechanosensitive channel [Methanocella paludicola SANAE]|uniref:Small-conductance mechanosensitive channel n=2 Tax=Methanocella TaxID=570266 RepID=D1YVT8_METPS|nr:putative small-conductance mechanosensitive channel [Methanocella paludicola SANAE]